MFRFANWVIHVEHVYRFAFCTVCRRFGSIEAEYWYFFTTDHTHFVLDIKHLVRFTLLAMRRCFTALEAKYWTFFTTDRTHFVHDIKHFVRFTPAAVCRFAALKAECRALVATH